LNAEESERFLALVEDGLKHPCGPVPISVSDDLIHRQHRIKVENAGEILWRELKGGTMSNLYVKKPVIIEAMEFTEIDKDRVFNWITCNTAPDFKDGKPVLRIQTLEGVMTANLGDWVIKGIKGEFYPIKNDIFLETYEKVELGRL